MKSLHHYRLVITFAWREGRARRVFWRLLGRYACTCRDGVFKTKAELDYHLEHMNDNDDSWDLEEREALYREVDSILEGD